MRSKKAEQKRSVVRSRAAVRRRALPRWPQLPIPKDPFRSLEAPGDDDSANCGHDQQRARDGDALKPAGSFSALGRATLSVR